ncbi:MAG: hypothetical protein ACRENI_03410 [Gemmatimonadaceae bacterium]
MGNGNGAATRDAGLVGSWSRTIYFSDASGVVHSSRTRWAFGSDGRTVREVTATNLAWGYSDTVEATALWRTENDVVVITWQSPNSGTVRFRYRVEDGGSTLFLGDDQFARVG